MKPDDLRPLGVPDAAPVAGIAALATAVPCGVAGFLFRRLMARVGDPPVEFRLAHGPVLHAPRARPRGCVVLQDAGVLWSLIRDPEMGFGDAYSAGRLSVQGDLEDVLYHLFLHAQSAGERVTRPLFGNARNPRPNSRRRARDHIRHHYDLGNDFYARWLDPRMVYTCAYYARRDMTLAEAQVAKLDYVCRKLELEPGMRVVEAGCGWGALALHMASRYGVSVRAFNISSSQIAYAREQAARQGLGARVEFVEDDYRNIGAGAGARCDAFVSIGMLEHVGRAHYGELGRVIQRCLDAHGRALLHSVGRSRPQPPNAWLERRIFPGSYPPALSEIMEVLEPYRFSVIDVENLRLHYARTLGEWLQRFDACQEPVGARYGEAFVRAWRLYLAGCAAGFRAGTLQLYQVLFTQPGDNRVPMTRGYLYGAGSPQRWSDG